MAPEVLHWARSTLRGITDLRGKARRREIEMDDEVSALLLGVERKLVELLDRNQSTDPEKWVVRE
jgi:hypothetical protein